MPGNKENYAAVFIPFLLIKPIHNYYHIYAYYMHIKIPYKFIQVSRNFYTQFKILWFCLENQREERTLITVLFNLPAHL